MVPFMIVVLLANASGTQPLAIAPFLPGMGPCVPSKYSGSAIIYVSLMGIIAYAIGK